MAQNNNQQFKITNMAKDFSLQSKEISRLLTENGVAVNSTSKVLTPSEFGIFLNAVTKENQLTDLGDYLSGKTVIKIKKKEKVEDAPKDAVPADAVKKADATPEVKAEVKPEVKAEPKVEEKKVEEKKVEEKKPVPTPENKRPAGPYTGDPFHRADNNLTGKRAEAAANAVATPGNRNNQYGQNRFAQNGNRPAPNGQFNGQGNRQGYNNGQNANRPFNNNGQYAGQGNRPGFNNGQNGNRPAGNGMGNGRFDNRNGMGNRAPFGNRSPVQNKPETVEDQNKKLLREVIGDVKEPRKKPTHSNNRPQNNNMDRDKDYAGPSGPKNTFKAGVIVRGTGSANGSETGTLVIDTHGSTYDESKYDDRFNTFVTEPKGDAFDTTSSRFKKNAPAQNTRNNFVKGKKGMKGKGAAVTTVKPTAIELPDEIVVGQLASKLMVTAGEVVKKLIGMGMMATINQTLDFDTAALVADEFGVTASHEVVVSIEEKLFDETEDADENMVTRAPVVCVMGHVDHGKTSILDAIRHTRVTAGEAGGITQHIGAYSVKVKGKDITFLDTPGHAAFTAMRARGAMATDIAILVVAADDGIMPQTIEAINHAKAAGIDIIVAINKMDKPTANPEAVKQELTKYNLVPEEWGGDTMCVPVSALTGKGIDDLLETVLLVAEVKELKANPDRRAKGLIIESKLDKGRGPVATILVQNGTLKNGDIIIAGTTVGRVRSMTDYTGKQVKTAGPSMAVEITGLADVPSAGDEIQAVADERMARELADQRKAQQKEDNFKAHQRANLNDLFEQISEGVKDLNVIVKADVDGSVEAVSQSLTKLSNEEVKVRVIHAAAGGITEGDVTFAAASNAIIVGFNVRPDKAALDSAERQGVDIRTYRIIYECIDEIKAAMKGMLAPQFKEALLGHAEVRQTIHVPNVGTIAGSYVQDGKVTRSSQIRVVRDGVVIFEDKISSLKRFKDDAKEVAQGFECGIGLEKFNDIKVGDILEAFTMEQIEVEL